MGPLILTLYFHPEPTGSAPPISDFALWLAERGQSPKVLTARPNYPDRVVFDGYRRGEHDEEEWKGVSIRRLQNVITRSSGIVGRLLTEGSFLTALVLHRFSCAKSSQVVSVCPSILVSLIAPLFVSPGGRHMAIVHDIQSGLGRATGASSFIMRGVSLIERRALNRADVIVTLSPEMADALRAMGVTRRIEIAPPQIDVRRIKVLPDPKAGLVVYSGAMGRKQGLRQILDTAEVLQSRGSSIRFKIQGQGGIKEALIAEATAKALKNIAFEPLVPTDKMSEAMAAASIHLVPQASDGADFAVPSKVFSIMASGRLFVATAHSGSPLARLTEESQAGICVPPDDPEQFADALEVAMKDDALRQRLGENGRASVECNADRSVVCEHIWRTLTSKGPANDTAQESTE